MKRKKVQKIVIIGCGNLAWHLALRLNAHDGFTIKIYNHRPSVSLKAFSTKLKCETVTNLSAIENDAAYYFICVPDRFIADVSKNINSTSGIVVHCSGSLALDIINQKKSAVLYPLQTFTKLDAPDWNKVSILLEGSSPPVSVALKKIAVHLSPNIFEVNSADRAKVHLAAVLVNNFTNALYTAADEFISRDSDLKFELLLPLIHQTTEKLYRMNPKEAQTGPARRGDTAVIEKHQDLIKNKRLKKVYRQLTKLIQQQHLKNG
jgi:predicted short-subunit dehydrogenase-like oxidoreductase (DUF2520 family)